jgi:hypothetical protein
MKRAMATLAGGFMLLIFIVSPAHALKAIVATIAMGEVQVIGIQAKINASISWEGNVVTQSNKLGLFQFSTTNLPQDCVGILSDGVSTIDVVISGCTTKQVVSGGVLKTGQTTCYDSAGNLTVINCSGTGQDGELQRGTARSYTDNGDGTITDNATGLVWEKLNRAGGIHDVGNTYTWEEAFQKIADLNTANFAGHKDWRLPNVNELLSLVNYGKFVYTEAIAAVDSAFDNGVDSFTWARYWSSTWRETFGQAAYVVDFALGTADPVWIIDPAQTAYICVRAVRGGS